MTLKAWLVTPLALVAIAVGSYAGWRLMQPAAVPSGFLYANGHIEGTAIDVSAELMGRVVEENAEEGATVEAGDVLARLDDSMLMARREELAARTEALEASRRGVAAERKTADHHHRTAAAELRRMETLYVNGQTSAQALDAARDAEVEAAGHLASLNARLAGLAADARVLQHQVRQLELQLEKTVIRAPSGGTVLVKGVEEGELASPGGLVARLVDLRRLRLEVFVAEADLGRIRLDAPARVRVSAFPERYFDARVVSVDQQAQFTPRDIHLPRERVRMVFGVTLELPNQDGTLKPGMPADAWVRWRPEAEWPARLAVPR